MNPKNMLCLLQKGFDEPQYNIDSVITEERNFASHLQSLIRDAVEDDLLIHTYESLNFEEESMMPDPQSVDEEAEIKESEQDLHEVERECKNFSIPVDLEYKRKQLSFGNQGKNVIRS